VKRILYQLLSCAAATALLGCSVTARADPIVPLNYLPSLTGDYFPLKSAIMDSEYHIYVRLPEGYSKDQGKRYPVVYLLDGDSAFPLIAPLHLFLTYDDDLPEAIVVGIAYGSFAPPVNHREADFGSRAAEFQRFLADELIPTVERRVRADPSRRVLIGQSFGASFVLFSAFDRPDLFWSRIASNPSARMHQQLLAGRPNSARRTDLHLLVVSGTANNPESRKAALDWDRKWRQGVMPWTFERIDIAGGTHAADFGNAYRLGLRKLFAGKD
jgi:predicted alpha/beta superfamily hydrolase